MSIKPTCDSCKKELMEYGAILLSPPSRANMVRKYHVCKKCYQSMLARFKSNTDKRATKF